MITVLHNKGMSSALQETCGMQKNPVSRQEKWRRRMYWAVTGTAGTAGIAVRIPPASAIESIELNPELEDVLDDQIDLVGSVRINMCCLSVL